MSDLDLLAAIRRGDVQAAGRALEGGASPRARSATGDSAIVLAAASGETALVELLLDNGAPVDDAGEAGNTALMQAAAQGQSMMVKLLLSRGADGGHANRWGLGPADWARWAKDAPDLLAAIQAKRS
ncbi:MAG: ankyrin repeat domain-containing protein [Alphaproteobacteria bacterium]|nr:ankyrin repeat domain-containing protein [Alphaproteobacteria bacterium]